MAKAECLNFCLLLNIMIASGQIYTSVIETASGPIRGLILTSVENKLYAAFKGIPYAKPPLGYLRFKPPKPIDRWEKIYDATNDGNMCIQLSIWGDRTILGSEDCLNLNIYTPHTVFNKSMSKAVMVWFHGSRYTIGDAGQSMYGPDFLMGEDVILVSFNHRLGALGFLNLNHENATGNAALKDQNMALKWIKKNIAQFGGDPDKITIFGTSAGSISVNLHVLSDMSVGLFSQSIAMSGSPLNLYWGLQNRAEAVANGFILGAELGTTTTNKDTLLKSLYEASPQDIVTAAKAIGFIPFRPTIENPDIARNEEKFLTKSPLFKYKTGNYTKGPHMMSFTSDEALLYFGAIEDQSNAIKSYLQSIKNSANNPSFLFALTNSITNGMENLIDNGVHGLVQTVSNLIFVLGIDIKQRLISKNNDYPIYYYRFSFTSNYSFHREFDVNLEGAGHADEMPYIFYMSKVFGKPTNFPLDQPDFTTTRRRLLKLYTNFAKYGNPTPDGEKDEFLGITWPDSRPSGVLLEIGKSLAVGPRPTSWFVKMLQFFELGKSSYFNEFITAKTNSAVLIPIGYYIFSKYSQPTLSLRINAY